MIFASVIFLIYNYYTFHFISKILPSFTKNPFIYIGLSIFNTILMILAYNLKSPYYVSYFIVLFILSIEFLIFSKSKFSQSFLCSGICIINISSFQLFFISVYSIIKNTTPYELFNNRDLFYENLSLLFIFLLIMLIIIDKFIPTEDIIKLSVTKNYSIMVFPIIIFILTYTIIDVLVLQSKLYFHNLFLMFISTSILNLILFYTLFFHSIQGVKMFAFKRKSDKLELEKYKNIINKINMENKVYKDSLTSCYNRKFVMDYLENFKKNNICNFTILFIDIDKLKFVNDTFGHTAGDEYIVNVSNCIKESIRNNDILARIGGDEFLVVLNDSDENNIVNILDRIKSKINFINNITKNYTVSISIGYIFVNEDLLKTGIENIIKIADANMRIEKNRLKEKNAKC